MKLVMPIQGKSAKELYGLNSNGAGGFYPIGSNNSYHGGVHFEGKNLPVVAIADGTIIAYRYNPKYLEETDGEKIYKYSNCFVLIRHEYKTPKGQEFTFYSHYNHLSPWDELKSRLTRGEQYPNLIIKPGYEIKTEGLNVRSSAEQIDGDHHNRVGKLKARQEVVASPVAGKPDWAKIEGANEYFSCKHEHVRPKPVVCIPQFDQIVTCELPIKAGAIVGYTGLCQAEGVPVDYYVTHVEVFAGEDAEDFINNVKEDGKPTLLKIAKGKELHKRIKKYPDTSALEKLLRTKGTQVEFKQEGDGEWVRVIDKKFVGTIDVGWLNNKYPSFGHYTAKTEYVDAIKEIFPGVDIVGEDSSILNVLTTRTSATPMPYISKNGTNRVVSVDAGDAAKEFWIRRSLLKNNNEILANSECCLVDPDELVQPTQIGTVPYECVVVSKSRVSAKNVAWHQIDIDGLVAWVKETDVSKVSPFDWAGCGFSVIKEEADDGLTLSDSYDDTQIDVDKLPEFFKPIFNQIDSSENKIIEDVELKSAIRKPEIAQKLSRMICCHGTEWDDGGNQFIKILEQVKSAFGQGAADNLKTRIEQMCWWGDVSDAPSSKMVYHWHPVAFVEQMRAIEGGLVTIEMVKAAGAIGDDEHLDKLVAYLNVYAVAYGIDTPITIAHFISQAGHESGMRAVSEGLYYSEARMKEIFTTKNSDGTRKYQKLWDSPATYAGHPEALANYVYANRMENGDEDSGDGYKYRGRGLIQLTGKYGYRKFTEYHNERYPEDTRNFVEDPDLIIDDMKYGVESAFAWWAFNNVNELCTGKTDDDVKTVSIRVNGGSIGLSERIVKFNKLAELIGL